MSTAAYAESLTDWGRAFRSDAAVKQNKQVSSESACDGIIIKNTGLKRERKQQEMI